MEGAAVFPLGELAQVLWSLKLEHRYSMGFDFISLAGVTARTDGLAAELVNKSVEAEALGPLPDLPPKTDGAGDQLHKFWNFQNSLDKVIAEVSFWEKAVVFCSWIPLLSEFLHGEWI